MNRIQDIVLLISLSFFSLFYRNPDFSFILAFLLCVTFCCTGYLFSHPVFHCTSGLLLLGISLVLPQLCLFFPAIFYLFFQNHQYILNLTGIIILGYYIFSYNDYLFILSLLSILLTALSFILQQRTEHMEQTQQKLIRIRDDSTEKNLLLEEKNRILVEKQDYEIYNATLKERNRIAREIHDNVGHLLSRSILLTGAAKTLNTNNSLSPLLDNLEESLNQAMTSIRSSVHDLHDESINLQEAVTSLIRDFTFCKCTLNYDMGFEIPREIKYCFISIIKEALSNVSRHSSADQVIVTLREHPAMYQLCIQDNGSASLTSHKNLNKNSSSGIGLSNIKDRVEHLNGTLHITADHGFRIFIIIPKEQE